MKRIIKWIITITLFSIAFIFITKATTWISDTFMNTTGIVNASQFIENGTLLVNKYKTILVAINLTPQQYTGNLVSGSLYGYDAGDDICNTNFTGSHFCTQDEVMQNIDLAKVVGNNDGWIKAGGPKYVPADYPVSDCWGFRWSGPSTYLGNYWKYNSTMGGYGAAITCNQQLNLSCCR